MGYYSRENGLIYVADAAVNRLKANDSPELRDQIVDTAIGWGRLDVWRVTFEHDRDMWNRFARAEVHDIAVQSADNIQVDPNEAIWRVTTFLAETVGLRKIWIDVFESKGLDTHNRFVRVPNTYYGTEERD